MTFDGDASPFEAMMDLANRIQSVDNAATRGAMVVELGRQIVAAQSQQVALVKRVNDLEKEITKFETWETEKQRYQLQQLPPGVNVFALIPSKAKPGEPFHQLCHHCYNRGEKSFLNRDEEHNGIYNLWCDACNGKWQIGHFVAPSVRFTGGHGEGGPFGWMGR